MNRRVCQAGRIAIGVIKYLPREAHQHCLCRRSNGEAARNVLVGRRGLGPPYTRGVTLLELILALALSVIVLAAVAWALQLHLRAFDTRRTDIEKAQLARAVLKLIADDLRSVIAHNAIDFTEAARLATMGDLEIDDGGDGDEGDDGDGGDENEEGEEEETGEETEEEEPKDLSADLTPSTIPGIYGNQYQLLMDVSRLPRIEDFIVTAGASDIPSDVKTIAYYLQPATMATASDESGSIFAADQAVTSSSAGAAQGWGRGLVRRSLDRSVTQWAVENGDPSRLDAEGELVAAEVVALEFRYFDGAAWLTEWDTQTNAGLPQAIEVAIAIKSSDEELNDAPSSSPLSNEAGLEPLALQSRADVKVYSQIIRIPAAVPVDDVLEEPEELKTDAE